MQCNVRCQIQNMIRTIYDDDDDDDDEMMDEISNFNMMTLL